MVKIGGAKRYPVRGFFSGVFLGLGLSVVLISYRVIALGTLTPWIVVLLCAAAGVAFAMFFPVPVDDDTDTAAPERS